VKTLAKEYRRLGRIETRTRAPMPVPTSRAVSKTEKSAEEFGRGGCQQDSKRRGAPRRIVRQLHGGTRGEQHQEHHRRA
jgi:hypothetical protein